MKTLKMLSIMIIIYYFLYSVKNNRLNESNKLTTLYFKVKLGILIPNNENFYCCSPILICLGVGLIAAYIRYCVTNASYRSYI